MRKKSSIGKRWSARKKALKCLFYCRCAGQEDLLRAKNELERVNKELKQALEEAQIANRAKNELLAQMETLASIDPLTGLFNRRHILDLGQKEFLKAKRHQRPLSVLMIDIDHFKQLNDTYGHDAGDVVLKALTDVFIDSLRMEDVCGRWGGEEFIVVLPETNGNEALLAADRLRTKFSEARVHVDSKEIFFTASIGVAQMEQDDLNIRSTINLADKALYEAKRGGRNKATLQKKEPFVS